MCLLKDPKGEAQTNIINAPIDAKDVTRMYQELLNTPRKMPRIYLDSGIPRLSD